MIRKNPATNRALVLKFCVSIVSSIKALKQYTEARSPLPLLQLQEEKLQQFALQLQLKSIPPYVAISSGEQFTLIHTRSEFQLLGQFTQQKAAIILVTGGKDWAIEKKQIPTCNSYLLALLEDTCRSAVGVGVGDG